MSFNKKFFILNLFLLSSVSYALDPPHDSTFSIDCRDCHTLHKAPGLNLVSSWGNWYLCVSCHSPGNLASNYPLSFGDQAIPYNRGHSHRWYAYANNTTYQTLEPLNPNLSVRVKNGKIMCSTCHDQHSQSNAPFDPSSPPSGSGRHFQRIPNDLNQMCLDCHRLRNITDVTTYTGSKLSHPVGVVYDPGVSDNLNPAIRDVNGAFQSGPRFKNNGPGDSNVTNNLILDFSENVNCMSCHWVTYTDDHPGTIDKR